MIRPFFVLALPRSRTAWLSRFLTYREWICGHEELRHVRSLEDAKSWLSQPFTGSAETAGAPFWRLLPRFAPEARVIVVRRPVDQVVASLLRLDTMGAGAFDPVRLERAMRRLDAKLDQVAARWPRAIEVGFAELEREDVCARVFEHCLPYPHDPKWWGLLANVNLQASMAGLMRYMTAFGPQMQRVSLQAKQAMLSDLAIRPSAPIEGVEFSVEPFETFYRDCQELFAEHLCEVGESPLAYSEKNLELMNFLDKGGGMQILVARCNGKPFGYLMSELSPSRERRDLVSAVHTGFFASKAIPGLGLKMQREALRVLKSRGVGEVWFRAGPRGDGPRMGTLYRRLGAADDGALYRLNLQGA
jgi:hypothetical protein